MTTINMHMKFEIEIPNKLDLNSGNHVTYRIQKPKSLKRLPGSHFDNYVAENQ